jgi:hypothetical protein
LDLGQHAQRFVSNYLQSKEHFVFSKIFRTEYEFQPSYSVNIWGILPGLKLSNCNAIHLSQSSTKAINEQYYTSTPPFSFISFSGIIFCFSYLDRNILKVFKGLILYIFRATMYICEILTPKFCKTLFNSELVF